MIVGILYHCNIKLKFRGSIIKYSSFYYNLSSPKMALHKKALMIASGVELLKKSL